MNHKGLLFNINTPNHCPKKAHACSSRNNVGKVKINCFSPIQGNFKSSNDNLTIISKLFVSFKAIYYNEP